jgi:hypothetical protein
MDKKELPKNTPNARTTRGRELPFGIAEISQSHGPLPSWYRYDVGLRDSERTPRHAFEMLVSAACYLANRAVVTQADSSACALLSQCARTVRNDVAEIQHVLDEAEAQVWQEKQIRWKRYGVLSKPRSKPSRAASPGLLARWLGRGSGGSRMVPL